jgi:release factor glutamine methyltransferase
MTDDMNDDMNEAPLDPDGSAYTLRRLWSETTVAIGDRSSARWLCEEAAALDGDEFVDGLDEPVTTRMVAHLDAMLARHLAGEPLQYVLGRWSFRHLDLAIDQRVLIPRPETEEVAGVAIELARAVHRATGAVAVADLGTGSGAIGLSMADELPLSGTTVLLTDRSAHALDVARANLAGLGRAGANVRIAQGEWFDAIAPGERFDVIVSNPPYVATTTAELQPSVRDWEPHDALFAGDDGLDDLRVIIAGAPARLCAGGWLVLEIGADQADAVCGFMEAGSFSDVEVRSDVAGHPRIALGRITSERPSP